MIGHKVFYRVYNRTDRKYEKWQRGVLLAWSMDHDQYEGGPGHFPVAIVKHEFSGECRSVRVDDLWLSTALPDYKAN